MSRSINCRTANFYFIHLDYNPDWSGGVTILWRKQPADNNSALVVDGADLLQGVNIPEGIPREVAAKAISLAVNAWWRAAAIEAVENITITEARR